MSNFNERNSGSGERLTVAGIAAVIVVGVFVVCVILILAKSLFPSNDESVPDGIYTGTLSSQSDAPKEDKKNNGKGDKEESKADEESKGNESLAAPEPSESEDTPDVTGEPDEPEIQGETAYLTQTAYLRSANDENAEPILSISYGETVTVLERPSDTEYVHVNYNGYDGWVWYGYLG